MILPTFGLGTGEFGQLRFRTTADEVQETLQASWDSSIRFYDTSIWYGAGRAERLLGSFLTDKPRDSYILSTKIGRYGVKPNTAGSHRWTNDGRGDDRELMFDYSYDGCMRSYEQALCRLGVARIDLLLIHDLDYSNHSPDNYARYFKQAMDEKTGCYRAMQELKASGDICAIGIGVNNTEVCQQFSNAADFDNMILAGRYTLLEQDSLSFLDMAQQKGIGVIAAGIFNSSLLVEKDPARATFNYAPASEEKLARVAKIRTICEKYGVDMPATALAFPSAHPAIVSILIGPSHLQDLREILAWTKQNIPAEVWDDLKASGIIKAASPTPLSPPPYLRTWGVATDMSHSPV